MINSTHLLICPLDATPLTKNDNSWQCLHNHQFDIARQGYVNLLPVQNKRSKSPGDTKEMVNARRDYLATQAYQPISDKLNELIIESFPYKTNLSILDAGCGEGYYLARLNKALTHQHKTAQLYGLDIAKFAIQAAAKTDKNSFYLVASNRAIPLADASLDSIYCAFGFPVFEEFAKKLTHDGQLILVESGADHLIELRKLIYPSIKPYQVNPYPQAEISGFKPSKQDNVKYQITLDKSALANLLLMTPHIHKASKEKQQALAQLDQLTLTIDVNYRVFELAHV
ncbi:methyltransferase domain-containing protein [Catenovulum sp. 2E275]|uniref:putative RNA methyltransferase n=1 Tax=Catenovulum sp. 2E275 TaxID=2980497 RepID=UPI0021D11CC2|nr:methyltransferase domain-containing protein [Catenovulum sp. 2E275]MCU4674263.1 methyltransferase domain-containing protein [Catenovulum sp. 2E275]